MSLLRRLPFALLFAATLSPAFAGDIVNAEGIVKALTSKPKAVKQADGKWVTPDASLDLQVAFDFNKSTLTPLGQQQLDQLALAFQYPALAQSRFELAGHTDRVGSYDANMKLSTDRAVAVRDYLRKRHSLPLERMLTQGYGYTRPADPQNPAAAVNRRVEVRHLTAQAYGAGVQPYLQPVQAQPAMPPVQANPAAQPYFPGQGVPGQPMPGQPMPMQPMPVQAMPVQPMPVQPMPVQPMPVQAMPVQGVPAGQPMLPAATGGGAQIVPRN